MQMIDYLKLLEHSYKIELEECSDSLTRIEFLSMYIFGFTTYDEEIDNLFVRKALEVCIAISKGETYVYIKDKDNYQWFMIMCNMPFFINKLSWGGSIRGAWWGYEEFTISSCGLWDNYKQLDDLKFTREQWYLFIEATDKFAKSEIAQ